MKKPFTLKGWHVLAILVCFFGIVITANLAFMAVAIRSFPGEETRNPFEQGVKFNDKLAQKAAQDELGWIAEIAAIERTEGDVNLIVNFRDRHGAPVLGLAVGGLIRRPSHDGEDRTLEWRSVADGSFEARAVDVAPGLWEIMATAEGAGGETFSMSSRLVID